uniref:DNA methylase N-4/N-6 domain-containing protein n=1 Tax=viral metagenome TaxID=1070528 RepID=A0A6C0IHM3_9ZZZZ
MYVWSILACLAKNTNSRSNKIDAAADTVKSQTTMDYASKTLSELKTICRERKIKGFSGKSTKELITLIQSKDEVPTNTIVEVEAPAEVEAPMEPIVLRQDVLNGDTIVILPTLESDSAQIIIADPPYNIGKDFGNDSDKQPMDEYLIWCEKWIKECLRILKPNGTMFIYGFSEILALILSKVPYSVNRRWIVWHYTNKNVPSLNFWQRSHESILVLWKSDKVFHRDDIREAYTEGFLNGAAGKERKATKGRFSKGDKSTTYTAHANGALPRDVIKVAALAGGAGMNERVNHPTQKPLTLCDKLIRSCKQSATDGYVLVPFAGSGSECLAAKKLGLPFVGIELNPEYVTLIHQRLEEKTQTEEVVPPSESLSANP